MESAWEKFAHALLLGALAYTCGSMPSYAQGVADPKPIVLTDPGPQTGTEVICHDSPSDFASCPKSERNFHSVLIAVHGWGALARAPSAAETTRSSPFSTERDSTISIASPMTAQKRPSSRTPHFFASVSRSNFTVSWSERRGSCRAQL